MPGRSSPLPSARDAAAEQRIHQRPAPVAWRRMHDHAGGLVDDDEVLILVHDGQRNVLGQDIATGRRWNHDHDCFAASRPVARAFVARCGPPVAETVTDRSAMSVADWVRDSPSCPATSKSRRTSLSASSVNSCRVPDESAVTTVRMRD